MIVSQKRSFLVPDVIHIQKYSKNIGLWWFFVPDIKTRKPSKKTSKTLPPKMVLTVIEKKQKTFFYCYGSIVLVFLLQKKKMK